jgi:hypothetical protein
MESQLAKNSATMESWGTENSANTESRVTENLVNEESRVIQQSNNMKHQDGQDSESKNPEVRKHATLSRRSAPRWGPRGITKTQKRRPLLEKGPWVSAGNPLLVSARLANTIYRI